MKLLGFVFLLLSLPALAGNRIVIDELRKLKATLPVNDPSRGEITLRLADRLADEYLVGKDKTLVKSDSDRVEAIALYQESLPIRQGEAKIKIQFQMARLYAEKVGDAAATKSAQELFELVRTTSQIKEFKRESNMRLAEMAEANPKTAPAAVAYYREALTLCEGTDSCSYSHYRLGWIERNHENLPAAIEEMKLALWDSKGQLREEAIRDLVTFMGLASAQVDQSIPYLDQLSAKVARPALLQDLAYAYFSSGNKAAGVKVLALTHSRAPTIYSEMRLMEEYYGLRQWDQFRAILAQFNASVHAPVVPGAPVAEIKDAVEIEKIGRRLATQLDGERTTDASRFEDFKQFTLSYLDLFPKSPERAKIMEGMIAAEPNQDAKLAQLKIWLSDTKFALPVSDEVKLRELRAAIAQKEPVSNAVVIEEMSALVVKNPAKAREYRYVRARAQYAMKDFAAAAPEFAELAAIQGTPDNFAIQSQHLLLDIYNQQKDLAKIVAQARVWTTNATLAKDPKFAADVKEMAQIAEQAEFEGATQQAESVASLDTFMNYCQAGKFLPKSCENAKVLSVKLNQHPKLIGLLELQAKSDPKVNAELMDQYEDGGYFAKAAEMMSKANAKAAPEFKTAVKTALLYEVGRDTAGRDNVLKQMTQSVLNKKMKLAAPEEKALLSFLNDTHMLNASLMNVLSAPESKNFLAENLEEQNLGNKQTLQILLGNVEYQGTAWSKRVVEKADALANEEAKIKFYGRNGQVAFQKRVNRLKELNQFSDKYLNGSDALTRTKLLTIVKMSHERIGNEIMASPLPPNLNEEQMNQVKTSLAEMAKPFQDKAESLKKLLEVEEQKVSLTQSSAKSALDETQYQQAITQLHQNPKNVAALTQLKTLFTNAGQGRPAAYFEGRIQAL